MSGLDCRFIHASVAYMGEVSGAILNIIFESVSCWLIVAFYNLQFLIVVCSGVRRIAGRSWIELGAG